MGGYGYRRYDFAVDEEKLETVSKDMKANAEKVREKITEIYNIIDNDLSNSWRSTAYDDFKAGCHNYEQGLKELANMIELFGTSSSEMGIAAETMMSNINAKF